jgi:hypothetical protein
VVKPALGFAKQLPSRHRVGDSGFQVGLHSAAVLIDLQDQVLMRELVVFGSRLDNETAALSLIHDAIFV